MPKWNPTKARPFLYWITGTALMGSFPIIDLIDIMLAPNWHAPHWQCDSLGVVVIGTQTIMFQWALISAAVSGILAFFLTRKRSAGANILDFSLGNPPWNWITNSLFAIPVCFLGYAILEFVWQAAVPQTIIADCDGRAEEIEVIMTRPWLQFTPLLYAALMLWFLHLRALALSPPSLKQASSFG